MTGAPDVLTARNAAHYENPGLLREALVYAHGRSMTAPGRLQVVEAVPLSGGDVRRVHVLGLPAMPQDMLDLIRWRHAEGRYRYALLAVYEGGREVEPLPSDEVWR